MEMAELDIYKNAEVAIQNAYGIYLDHEKRLSKASAAIDGMLEKANNGMDDDTYQNASVLLKRVQNTIKTFQDERKPVTQAAQAIVKAFTAQENALDLKNAETKSYALKVALDNYAAQKEIERKQKEREGYERIERDREANSILIQARSYLEKVCIKAVAEMKSNINAMLNSVSLENYEDIRKELLAYDTRVPEGMFKSFDVEVRTVFVNIDQKQRIFDSVKEQADWDELKDQHEAEIGAYLHEAIAKLPSIKTELEELANADKAKAEEMLRQKKVREQEEAAALEAQKRKQELDAELSKREQEKAAELQASFDFGMTQAQVASPVKAKNEYQIEVVMPSGLMEITRFWLTNQQWPMDEEKVMRVTFERMKKFAENEATKNDNFIKSEFVKYKEITTSKI